LAPDLDDETYPVTPDTILSVEPGHLGYEISLLAQNRAARRSVVWLAESRSDTLTQQNTPGV